MKGLAKAQQIFWIGTKQQNGTVIATCKALDLTVELTSDSKEGRIEEIVEVTEMVLESLREKGILDAYCKERGIALPSFPFSPLPMDLNLGAPVGAH